MQPFLFDRLESEWPTIARSNKARRAVASWAASDARLGRFGDLAEVVSYCNRRHQPQASDAILARLVRLASDDELAARTILQALLPGLRAVAAASQFTGEPEEVDAEVIATAWTLIRTYPFERRPARVAANIVLDVRKRLLTDHRRRVRAQEAEQAVAARAPAKPVTTAAEQALQILIRNVRSGALTPAQASLVASSRIAGYDLADAETNNSLRRSLRRTRRGIEARLVGEVA